VLIGTGADKFVFSAQTTMSSTLMEYAFLYLINVPPLTQLELVFHVTRDTDWFQVNVSFLPLSKFLIWAVLCGIGIRRPVFSVPTTGCSIINVYACLSPINAKLSTLLELVNHVTMAMSSTMEPVNLPLINKYQIWDVEPGTGPLKNAWPAQAAMSLTVIESAFLFLINALPTTQLEFASHATRVID